MYSCFIYHNGCEYQVDVTDNEKVVGVVNIKPGVNASADKICHNSKVDGNMYLRKRILTVARDHVVKKSNMVFNMVNKGKD